MMFDRYRYLGGSIVIFRGDAVVKRAGDYVVLYDGCFFQEGAPCKAFVDRHFVAFHGLVVAEFGRNMGVGSKINTRSNLRRSPRRPGTAHSFWLMENQLKKV